MTTHHPTTRRPHRKRRAADEAAAPVAERAEAAAQSLAALRNPALGASARGRAALGLQRAVGNAGVGRVVGGIQRYSVDVEPGAGCSEVIEWIDGNSPYAPEWAHTQITFSWSGSFKITGNATTGYTLKITGAKVTMVKSVDMPTWQPSDTAMQSAWQQAYAQLRAHEARHEAIGRRWKAGLLRRLRRLALPVNAQAQEASISESMVNAQWDAWLAEHQADHDAIDPFKVTLHCPTAEADLLDDDESTYA